MPVIDFDYFTQKGVLKRSLKYLTFYGFFKK